jgi:4-hydroxybenzoate polyprenyltransferase
MDLSPFSIRAYLQLVRFPAVFSAMADVLVGFLLVDGATSQGFQKTPGMSPVLLLVAASSCLYLAGMAFNDVFDRDVDARERPNRPIPSGRVPLRHAVALGVALIAGGIAAAAFAGLNSLVVATVLLAAIFAYDGVLKTTPVGPPAMGLCRTLNVLLGASAAADVSLLWSHPVLTLAGCYGVYIAGLTWFARHEAGRSPRSGLIAATVVIDTGLAAMFFLALNVDYGFGGKVPGINGHVAAAVVAVVVNRALFLAIADPSPQRVQRAVKTLLQWLIMLDATLVFAASGNAMYGLIAASLMVPAVVIGYWLYVT